ncbi:MAG: helix-turn-helix domain-containing protein [Proteobacteria bacterium]|nr:helix-turn-helix domain-containing protein [Pseudomonadota bacterium]
MTWKAAAQVEPLNMPTTLKFVLVKYANHADNDGYDTWPSYERVAHFTGLSVKTVQRAVERLRAESVLVDQGAPYGGRGKRGRGIAYRLDFARAEELYGYWIETRTDRGFAFKLVPGIKDPKVEAEAWRAAEKKTREGSSETPDRESSVCGGQTQDSQGETQDSDDLNSGHVSGATPRVSAVSHDEPSKNPPESARAREAGGAHGPGGADAPSSCGVGGPEGPPKACAVWRDNRAGLEALACWPLLERAIPDADDGETLTLAVETPLVGFAILAWAAREAEAVLGRCVACRVRRWVQPALIQRGIQKAGAAEAGAHRREGETVTLADPAWRMWRAKATGLGAAEISAITALCLPDDLDQTGLVLMVGSVAVNHMLHEEGGTEVARVLGVPIRTRYLWCMDIVLDARAAHRSLAA